MGDQPRRVIPPPPPSRVVAPRQRRITSTHFCVMVFGISTDGDYIHRLFDRVVGPLQGDAVSKAMACCAAEFSAVTAVKAWPRSPNPDTTDTSPSVGKG